MTLELTLVSIKDLWGGQSKPSYLYVQGGQSGSLRLQVKNLPQSIKCSTKDHLEFIICGSKSDWQPQNGDIISKQDFWAQSFLDQNRYKFQKQNQSQQYTMQYYNSKHDKQGQLNFEVKYTRGLFYQGQIQRVDAIRRKLVPFYKGKCPTFNFYNCLDSKEGIANCNFIEHIYKDQ